MLHFKPVFSRFFIGFTFVMAIGVLSSLGEKSQALSAERRSYTKPKGWYQIVEAARQEGKVVIYGPRQLGFRPILGKAFNKTYPKIKLFGNYSMGRAKTHRILAERRANYFIPDILIGGPSSALSDLKPAGALAPIRPHLLLPEVLDESAWLGKRLSWVDADPPYTVLAFVGYVNIIATFNTNLVKPDQIKSFYDLLNPKWKGKIVARDVRRPGPGSSSIRFIYNHPNLGPPFLERLFSEMDLTLSSNQRQMMDWLARGRFQMAFFLPSGDIIRAQEQGLPVAPVPMTQFKEGVAITAGGGAVSIMDRAPHPNAATVFLNWFLSREGQAAWQRAVPLPSRRTDISKSEMNPFTLLKPGIDFMDMEKENYIRTQTAARRIISRALAKAKAGNR